MEILVWIGAALSILGLIGIVISAVLVFRARRQAAGNDEVLRARMGRILPLNIGALFVSMLGLMMVVVGVLLS